MREVFAQYREDLRDLFRDRTMRWLHVSILVFIMALPYHLVRVPIPWWGRSVQITKVAFIAITIFGTYAFLKRRIILRRAYWLYAFLALHVLAQGVSLKFAPAGFDALPPAIAAATYSAVLFILVNALQSERLLRVILPVMGLSVLPVVIHSLVLFVMQDWVFRTRAQPSIIGNDIGNYLGYLLVMYGVGVLYMVFMQQRTWARLAVVVFGGAWMYTTIITGVKIAHLAVLLFLFVLIFILRNQRKLAVGMMLLFVTLFGLQMNLVSLQNAFVRATFSAPRESSITATRNTETASSASVIPPPPPVSTSASPPAVLPPPLLAVVFPFVQSLQSLVLDRVDQRIAAVRPSVAVPSGALLADLSDQNWVRVHWSGGNRRSSIELRMRGMLAGIAMGVAYPFTGVGPGQQAYFFDHFSELIRERSYDDDSYFSFLPVHTRSMVRSTTKYTISYSNPHNLLIMTWAETGALGLIAMVGILAVVIARALGTFWRLRNSGTMYSIYFFFPSFLGLLMFQLVNFFELHPWFWTTLALVYVAAWDADDDESASRRTV